MEVTRTQLVRKAMPLLSATHSDSLCSCSTSTALRRMLSLHCSPTRCHLAHNNYLHCSQEPPLRPMLVGGAVIAHLREIAAAEPEQFCAPTMDGSLPAELSVTVLATGSRPSSMVKRASQTLLQSLHASRASAAASAAAAAAASANASAVAAASTVTAGILAAIGNARAW